MNAEIQIEYTPAMVAAIARRNFLRLFSLRWVIAIAATWLMCGSLWVTEGATVVVLLLTGGLSVLTFFGVALFVIVQKRAVGMLRRFDPPVETVSFDEDGMSVITSLGESSIRWEAIRELFRYPDVWFLCVSKEVFLTLPITQVPSDLQEEIVNVIRAGGGKIS